MRLNIKFNIGDTVYFLHPETIKITKGVLFCVDITILENGINANFNIRYGEIDFVSVKEDDLYSSREQLENKIMRRV